MKCCSRPIKCLTLTLLAKYDGLHSLNKTHYLFICGFIEARKLVPTKGYDDTTYMKRRPLVCKVQGKLMMNNMTGITPSNCTADSFPQMTFPAVFMTSLNATRKCIKE